MPTVEEREAEQPMQKIMPRWLYNILVMTCTAMTTVLMVIILVLLAKHFKMKALDIIAAVKLTASTGGGMVCIASIDTKAFILKCFPKSTSIITISTVVIAVHVITRILLSHLGIIFCMGCSASFPSTVGIFCPSIPIVSIIFLNPLVDPISLSVDHIGPLKIPVLLLHIEVEY